MTLQERAAPTRQETRISKVRERTICLSFGSHRVVIESNAGEVLEGLTAVVSPMIACDARGEIAATFRVIRAGKDFVIQGSDGNDEAFTDPRQATRVLYHRAVKALIDARPDLLWVHAAAASLERQAILLSGPSGQGKSTLIAELLGRGYSYLSDDVAPIDSATATVLPFPLSPYKRVPAQRTLSSKEAEKLAKVAIEISPQTLAREPSPLSHIFFLRYAADCTTATLTPCSPGMSIIELLRNSFGCREVREIETTRLCPLVKQVPCSYLTYADAQEAARHVVSAGASRA